MAYAILLLGIVCAGFGGEFFLRGAVGLARWARISAGIIGATVAAFATSSPELTVAINAALIGAPQVALGDLLGSNVLNIALILGLTLLFGDLRADPADIRRELPVAVCGPVALFLLALDGTLSRADGLLLLTIFLAWLALATVQAARQRSAIVSVAGPARHWPALLWSLAGLGLLFAAGRLIVVSAVAIALTWGVPLFIIGAVIVAVGTSVPELATTILAKVKGHDEVGLGTVLGSNIFNGYCIIGIAAIITPIPVTWSALAAVLAFGLVAVLFAIPARGAVLPRWRGFLLLALYAAYVVVILRQPHG